MRKMRKYARFPKILLIIFCVIVFLVLLSCLTAYEYIDSFFKGGSPEATDNTLLINSMIANEDLSSYGRSADELLAIANAYNESVAPLGFKTEREVEETEIENFISTQKKINASFVGTKSENLLMICTNKQSTEMILCVIISANTDIGKCAVAVIPAYTLVDAGELGYDRLGKLFLYKGVYSVRDCVSEMLGIKLDNLMISEVDAVASVLGIADKDFGYEIMMKKSGFELKKTKKKLKVENIDDLLKNLLPKSRSTFTMESFIKFGLALRRSASGGIQQIIPSTLKITECIGFGDKTAVKTDFSMIRKMIG